MKRKSLLKFLLVQFLLLIGTVLFAGCSKDTPNTPENPGSQEQAEPLEVDVIQPETTGKKIEGITEDGTVVFENLTNEEIPQVGTAICSGPTEGAPRGFLYKVKEVTTSNGKTFVKTEFAALEQVVQNGEAHQTIEMTEDNIAEVTDGEGRPLEYSFLPATRDLSSGVKVEINKENLFGHQDAFLKGTLECAFKCDFDLVIKEWSLKKFSALIYPQVKIELKLGMSVKSELKGEILLGRIKLTPITIMIGAVPVVVTPQFDVYAQITATGKIEISVKLVEATYIDKFGIAYDETEGWSYPGFDSESNQDTTNIEFMKDMKVSMSGELNGKPRILGSFAIYNINSGVGIGMDVYGKLKFEVPIEFFGGTSLPLTLPEITPKMKLTAGISGAYKTELKIFKKTLIDIDGSIDIIKWDIWERPIFPTFSDVSHESDAQGNVVVKCKIKELPMYAFDISQHGFCWVEGSGVPTIDGQHNELGEISTLIFENMGEQEMEVVLKNLKPNTTYTIRPYYTTWLGTFYPKEYSFHTGENENEIINGGYGIELVSVKGGSFFMGNNVGEPDESPLHFVTLSDFYISKTEVTQAQWKAIMGSNQSYFDGDNRPAEQVSWNDVQLFIKRLNQLTGKEYRLPTEAEWEFAARGGNKSNAYIFAGSNDLAYVGWYDENSEYGHFLKTSPVATKSPNELGLYDMSGNVWEWCQDWYDNNYYVISPDTNPTGPNNTGKRVMRGGSYYSNASECRVANRGAREPDARYFALGFRLALSKPTSRWMSK